MPPASIVRAITMSLTKFNARDSPRGSGPPVDDVHQEELSVQEGSSLPDSVASATGW